MNYLLIAIIIITLVLWLRDVSRRSTFSEILVFTTSVLVVIPLFVGILLSLFIPTSILFSKTILVCDSLLFSIGCCYGLMLLVYVIDKIYIGMADEWSVKQLIDYDNSIVYMIYHKRSLYDFRAYKNWNVAMTTMERYKRENEDER